jgi:hypothetical protein
VLNETAQSFKTTNKKNNETYIYTGLCLVFFNFIFSMERVQQLPSSDIFTVYHKDNILYAGGKE